MEEELAMMANKKHISRVYARAAMRGLELSAAVAPCQVMSGVLIEVKGPNDPAMNGTQWRVTGGGGDFVKVYLEPPFG